MPIKRNKKPKKQKRYIIVDNETDNALADIRFRNEKGNFRILCTWVYDFSKALQFDNLKLANCLINESQLKGTHIEEV